MSNLMKSNDYNALQQLGFSEKEIMLMVRSIVHQVAEKLNEQSEDIRKAVKAKDEEHGRHLKVIEGQYNNLKNDEVTTQSLNGLNNIIRQRAKEIVSKNGIQISLESFYDPKTMTADEKIKMDKNFQETFNRDVGKVSSAIKVSLKKYLGMKGNAPDKTFKQVDVDTAHKYVSKIKSKDLNL